jgi:uncharacterized protein YkwD
MLRRKWVRNDLTAVRRLPGFGVFLAATVLLAQTAGLAVTLQEEERAIAARMIGSSGQSRNRAMLAIDPVLTAVARERAADMARRRYFSHVNPDGNGPNQLMRGAGYALPESWGKDRARNSVESIGAGYRNADDAWRAWMGSRCHRAHLLATQSFFRDQTNIGIGYYNDATSPYRKYWVVITAPPVHRGVATTARM